MGALTYTIRLLNPLIHNYMHTDWVENAHMCYTHGSQRTWFWYVMHEVFGFSCKPKIVSHIEAYVGVKNFKANFMCKYRCACAV